jgi:hypothetical protein
MQGVSARYRELPRVAVPIASALFTVAKVTSATGRMASSSLHRYDGPCLRISREICLDNVRLLVVGAAR